MRLDGIHHISAITGDARRTWTSTRGSWACGWWRRRSTRTIPATTTSSTRTSGSPGAELTFFEYPGRPRGRAGLRDGPPHRLAGGLAEALDFWERRLAAEGVATERDGRRACASPTPRAWATSWW